MVSRSAMSKCSQLFAIFQDALKRGVSKIVTVTANQSDWEGHSLVEQFVHHRSGAMDLKPQLLLLMSLPRECLRKV